ncbi:TadE/TadG family type IV pilus assembly protein [Pelagerythrobacter marinus]|jgi:Flp pilus assembly protein TadG|uniref:TadE/TadG family type IV pilus assembly protein n=1 Tax=Pelagerythrobacter marinus TaxID=538382 RepID=UPI002036A716|nr:TadE/TadG family type IV pilus assembly protein [Pelagerythrobacter marinus]USA40666.1 pilus assembly protein [Pelagerythrobacter marinus]WPZ08468.1 TadE/TadG family type IV pilus assembly protein [Pelagerythrobacter marinus]
MRAAFARLRRDREGVTIIEFAIVAPVLLVFIFGILDLGHGLYMQSVLQGTVQNAGRDAGLESGRVGQAAIDADVRERIKAVMPYLDDDDIAIERQNYETFSDVDVPEDFDDTNGSGTYDDNECFTDRNNNGQWDPDVGADGLGGADDVVQYEVTVTYDRLLPFWRMLDLPHRGVAQATTVMRNQPFGQQATRRSVRICP